MPKKYRYEVRKADGRYCCGSDDVNNLCSECRATVQSKGKGKEDKVTDLESYREVSRSGLAPLVLSVARGRVGFDPRLRGRQPASEPERKRPLDEWLRFFAERYCARPAELEPPPAPSLAVAMAAKPDPRAFIAVAPPEDATPSIRAANAAQYDAERTDVPAAPSLVALLQGGAR